MLGKPAQNHGSKGLHGRGWVSGVLKRFLKNPATSPKWTFISRGYALVLHARNLVLGLI